VHECVTACEGEFGMWSLCSRTCGGGNRHRKFTMTVAAAGGGKRCDVANGKSQMGHCNEQPCPVACEAGAYTRPLFSSTSASF